MIPLASTSRNIRSLEQNRRVSMAKAPRFAFHTVHSYGLPHEQGPV